MSVRLSNINLFVADVASGVRFYSTVFGFEWDQGRSQPPGFAILKTGDLTLTLQSSETPGANAKDPNGVRLTILRENDEA